ncbi:unnamed protein product [Meloidogyne enterolobii]|uniref:Uncharacterized protein n=1 Tax=Meloidogyne enterolobii TaxID=390850 RepID=A0ACB0Y831_MELEN
MNSLLIYLIKTKTVAGMEIYKKLIYISCFMDLTVTCLNFIVQPVNCFEFFLSAGVQGVSWRVRVGEAK